VLKCPTTNANSGSLSVEEKLNMIRINGDGACYVGPPDSEMVPEKYLETLKAALHIIHTRIRGTKSCDASFQALPNGQALTAMIDIGGIWVSYDPSNVQGSWGWTIPRRYPRDVVLSQFALRMGRWSTAGTIIHELAHLNGADLTSHAAEETLKYCKLQSPNGPYKPTIRG